MKPGKDFIGIGAFGLIFNEKGQFLLIRTRPSDKKSKDYDNIWSMPGGTIEFGETVGEALAREIREETGLEISAPSLLCYNDFIWPEEGKHWVSLNFKAKTVGGDMTIADKTEVKECAWFDYATVPTNISQFTKRCLEITKCQ